MATEIIELETPIDKLITKILDNFCDADLEKLSEAIDEERELRKFKSQRVSKIRLEIAQETAIAKLKMEEELEIHRAQLNKDSKRRTAVNKTSSSESSESESEKKPKRVKRKK